ncbi:MULTISPECIES: phage baseplate plug family protein [Burkholderia]|uniref:phage baseplate plug family protein n=1 Tax=Burkholderia TaxID=32008 RepID=UPI000AEF192C
MILDKILVSEKAIGDIKIAVSIEERHNDELTITEHPVERGAQIVDHAFRKPSEVTIQCGWSNSDYAALRGTFQAFFDGGLPTTDYVGNVYSQLLALQQSCKPFNVTTSRRLYKNMLIVGLAVTTDAKTSAALIVTATLRELRLVENSVAKLPPTLNQADPSSTAEVQNMGTKRLAAGAPSPGGTVRGITGMQSYEIPLVAEAQKLKISLSGAVCQLTLVYRGPAGWVVDIGNDSGTPIVSGIPLVTGADLLAQYRHLGIDGRLWVQGDAHPDDIPTFGDLGIGSKVYWIAH